MSSVRCAGREMRLRNCNHSNGVGVTNCHHGRDVGVLCEGTKTGNIFISTNLTINRKSNSL